MATSQQQTPQGNLVERFDKAQKRIKSTRALLNHREVRCNVKRARKYIQIKRSATWKWQTFLGYPKTRTSYTERRTHGCGYLKYNGRKWAGRADHHFREYVELRDPKNAICHVFGNYCSEALTVSWCESRHDIWADNGQYLGLFQMGEYARSMYGHSNTALGQARSAYAYFSRSGYDWSPWACKPYGH